jgi:hypothetical protein
MTIPLFCQTARSTGSMQSSGGLFQAAKEDLGIAFSGTAGRRDIDCE